MRYYSIGPDLLPFIYDIENDIGGIFASFGYSLSPLLVFGQVADPGFYNLPTTTPVSTESVTYQAAGVPVSDSYTGTTLWNLLADAGGITTTTAKNDILSKYVTATGSDGYQAVFSAGETLPAAIFEDGELERRPPRMVAAAAAVTFSRKCRTIGMRYVRRIVP